LATCRKNFRSYDDLSIEEIWISSPVRPICVPEREREEKKRWVMAFSGLEGKLKLITGSLPGGWKQRRGFWRLDHA